MISRVIIIGWLLFGIIRPARTQTNAIIDSLIQEMSRERNDTLKARLINQLCDEYYVTVTDSVIPWAQRGLALTLRMPWPRGYGVFLLRLGTAFSDLGQIDSALFYLLKARDHFINLRDTFNLCSVYNNLGGIEQDLRADFPRAYAYFLKAIPLAEKGGFYYLSGILHENIAKIKEEQADYTAALQWAQKSLEFRLKDTSSRQSTLQVGESYNTLGSIYLKLEDTLKSRKYFQDAVNFNTRVLNNEGLARSFGFISTTYGADDTLKLHYLLKSKQLWDATNPLQADATRNEMKISQYYWEIYLANRSERANLKKAYAHATRAFQNSKAAQTLTIGHQILQLLADLERERGNFRAAYDFLAEFKILNDSIYSQETKNALARLESQKEIDQREQALQLSNFQLVQQKKQLIQLALFSLLLILMGFFIYRQSTHRKVAIKALQKANQKLDEANQLKSKLFGILSHDLRQPIASVLNFLQLIKFNDPALSEKEYTKHVQHLSNSTRLLLHRLESLLLWSKEQMKKFNPVIQTFSAKGLIAEVLENSQLDPGIQVDLIIEPESLKVCTDKNYFQTILNNLVTNSVKATTNQKQRNLKIFLRKTGLIMECMVEDNGPGLPAHLRNYLSTTTEETLIQSLGLTIIKELCAKLNIQIKVQNPDQPGCKIKLSWTEQILN